MTTYYPWQTHYWTQILARLHGAHMPHGLLISGPSGIGKVDFARALASLLLCKQKGDQPCGTCTGCHWFEAKTHPDFIELTPVEGKSTISINQVRELVHTLSQTAAAGGYQVVLMHPADAMTSAAANALLKTLEEPPGQVVLLLVSARVSALPATIISRCQAIKMAAPKLDEARQWLVSKLADPGNVDQLLAFADGLPLLAEKLSGEDFSIAQTLLGDFDALAVASTWHKEHSERLVSVMLSLLMDMVRCKSGVGQDHLRHQNLSALLERRSQCWQVLPLFDYSRSLAQDLALLRSQANPNVQLLLEKNLIQWQNCATL